MKRIDLEGFARKFQEDSDPWRTFSSRDEALKRTAILHALGSGPIGRVLELASGNGSNSAAIAPRALRLDATEGTPEGTMLTAKAIADHPRARAGLLRLPGCFPRPEYDAILIAELLYYLSLRDMARVAEDVAMSLRAGGRLVLAHHRIDFHDFVQHSHGIQQRFLGLTGRCWNTRLVRKTGRWSVIMARLL